MIRSALVLAGFLLLNSGALAHDVRCDVPEGLAQADFAMPHVAAAIAAKRLDVAVLGTASSALAAAGLTQKAYPARFEAALAAKLPGVEVRVNTYAKARQSAAEMKVEIATLLATAKPALVVWQTGTADAIRGIDLDEFRTALDEGIDQVHAAGVDMLLMNMQFSPRTESMIPLQQYVDALRFVALQHNVNLFDRMGIMKHWNETGVFDLSAATKKFDMAEDVHDCLGKLLARQLIEGADLTSRADKAND